ncbi:MAG TPA: Gfo/Idh/MocA family oxidoreductase [Fimbriimonadaceae bacterium]|nr:Gfo/Idh/MocA family oxidoreductase [Fimbriimonadaceae bacterium]
MTRVGIIGGGLMGKEVASALARWCALEKPSGQVELVAVADVEDAALGWFERISSVGLRTKSYQELLAQKDIDVVYVAVPHDLHENIYTEVIRAGKDLFAEKPFGMDLRQSMNLALSARTSGRFVRCSSEFPFYPGAQRIVNAVKNGDLGKIFEVRAGFWHSSDLDPEKLINWKRQKSRCGEAGVMNDLGLHVWHIPLRLGWKPIRVHAQLQNIIPQRRDATGQWVACDTDDNAIWNADCLVDGREVSMRMETKRIMPGETNTWFLEVYGEQGSMKFSTKEPKTLWTCRRNKEQIWERVDLGHQTQFPVVTGAIFEFGFPDAFLQMWAAFLAERSGQLGNRFGCATPEEAVAAHSLNEAALQSARDHSVVSLDL